MNDKEEWLKKRKTYITGTDAASILGLNPWCTNIKCWELKTGRSESQDISDKPAVKYGLKAESPLIELFKLDFPHYKVSLKNYDFRIHKDFSFIAGTLDGELFCTETKRKGILEIKTANVTRGSTRKKWENSIPENYFIQVLHYFLVTAFDFAVVKAALKNDLDPKNPEILHKHYHLEREDFKDDIEYLKTKELEFWDCVLKDTPPPLVLPSI